MSDGSTDDWVYSGRGVQPTLRWSFTVDAPLVDVKLGRETGEVFAADRSGGLSLLDRRGHVQSQTQTRHELQRVAWCDNGTGGAVAFDNTMIGWIDRRLQFSWTREVPDEVLAITVDPHGTHLVVAMANGVNLVFTSDNKRFSRFETIRPLRHLQLLATSTDILAAADHGLVGRYALRGDSVWTEKLWSNVGDLAATGDGRSLFLAGFTHGAQLYDGEAGASQGTFVAEGTVGQVACGFSKKYLVAATLERQLFAVDESGNLVWHLTAPEEVTRILLAPLADWTVVGFASGRIVRLDSNR